MDKKQHSKSAASESSSPSTINKSQKSSSTTAAASLPTITTSRNAVLPQTARRILQNFLLVWLDANFDESKDDYEKPMKHLQHIVATVAVFTDVDESIDFLTDIENEKVFMIVSGALAQHIIPIIQECPQIDSLFMYTQLLKEALLQIEDDDAKSIKELVEYCRLQSYASETTLEKFEEEYRNHSPIWWYTGPYFIYSMLNYGLRQMDVDIILKMGFFIRHLHQHIKELHSEQEGNMPTNFQLFRGQGLSIEDFETMKKAKGGLMSFNNFLSTSRNREISFNNFARPAALNTNSVGILFIMNIDTGICTKSSTPYAEVSKVGYYKGKEEEILFSTHAIFRINRIERLPDNHCDRLYEVTLTIVGNDNHELNTLTAHIRKDLGDRTGWSRLGFILIQLGEPAKAEQLYQILLAKASSDQSQAEYNHQLGWV
ncbi:unnamed protein product, partial [Rotaria sp. Silwood1]